MPAPGIGASPMRPGSLPLMPPVETATASLPSESRATAPTVSAPVSRCWRLRSEEHTSELQSHLNLVCRLLLEKKKKKMAHTQEHVASEIREIMRDGGVVAGHVMVES